MQFDAVLSWCTYSSDVSSICICLQYYELIKYSDTLASANAVNEKSHCGAVIIWQSMWFPLSLGRYDKRDFVVRRLPRIRSQRTSEKASLLLKREWKDMSSWFFRHSFRFRPLALSFFSLSFPLPRHFLFIPVSYLSIWWHGNFSRWSFYCVTNRR